MEQTENIPPEAAAGAIALPAARVSNWLTDSLIEPALDAGRDPRPGRAQRADGWTPERIRIFLNALAECGVVADAARAAGMSANSARHLRNRTPNRAFHLAWAAAEQIARRRIASDLMSRAIHGCVEVIVRDGVREERHRYDNRLTMNVLHRLDRQAEAYCSETKAVGIVAQEFDQFLDIVCDKGIGAAEFIAAREDAEEDHNEALAPRDSRDVCLLERAENYRRYGFGLPGDIPVSDLDPVDKAGWTEEQQERARRSGLLGDPDKSPGARRTRRIAPIRRIILRPGDPDAEGEAGN